MEGKTFCTLSKISNLWKNMYLNYNNQTILVIVGLFFACFQWIFFVCAYFFYCCSSLVMNFKSLSLEDLIAFTLMFDTRHKFFIILNHTLSRPMQNINITVIKKTR